MFISLQTQSFYFTSLNNTKQSIMMSAYQQQLGLDNKSPDEFIDDPEMLAQERVGLLAERERMQIAVTQECNKSAS